MNLRLTFTLLALSTLAAQPLLAQHHTERGAVLGGLGGALAGAAIGEHDGDAAAGAAIGGVLGLVTGAAIGNSMDHEAARVQAYQQQRAYQLSRAATTADVVTMTRSGLGDHVIINHIQQHGVQRRLEVSEVIQLHQQGVSDAVITAMQRAPLAARVAPPVARYPSPVIVERHHHVAPPCYYRPPPYGHYGHHRYPHHAPRTSVHWSFGVGR